MKTAILIVLLWAFSSNTWGVTFNITAGVFRTAGGVGIMPTQGLVILALSAGDTTFSAPTATDFFPGTDDLELNRWDLSVNTLGPGTIGPVSSVFAYTGDMNAGDHLQLYWFPSLTVASSAPGAGTSYGTFRTDSIIDFSDSGWVLPANESATIALNFLTTDAGGSNPNSSGWASFLVPVPEPSSYAAVLGALSLVGAAVTRRIRAGRR